MVQSTLFAPDVGASKKYVNILPYFLSIAIFRERFQLRCNVNKTVSPLLKALPLNELKFVHDIAVILDGSKFTNGTVTQAAVALGEERRSNRWLAKFLKIHMAIDRKSL